MTTEILKTVNISQCQKQAGRYLRLLCVSLPASGNEKYSLPLYLSVNLCLKQSPQSLRKRAFDKETNSLPTSKGSAENVD
jgi:hypothetical protein